MAVTVGREDRGDIKITIELAPEGHGIEVELESSLERLYGESIREQIKNELKKFGIADAKVKCIDDGALPYVISARVEAAARLLLGEGEDER